MDQQLFANAGEAVSIAAINEDLISEMTLGELAYANALFSRKFSERLAQPESVQEIATFSKAAGVDWSGFKSQDQHSSQENQGAPPPEPVAPDNYVDTVPAIMCLMKTADRTNDAAMVNLVRKLDVAVKDQTAYLGVPDGLQGYANVKEVLRQYMRISGRKAGKLQTRAVYVGYGSDTDRTVAGATPKLPKVAASFTTGQIPGENLDRIIQMDEDLTKYASVVGQTTEYKDDVIGLFEPVMVDAAETATPEELTQAKQRWIERIAHHIDADGPPLSKTLKKQPDNALQLRSHSDGSATASMHMDPIWTAFFKEFINTNLNYKGNRPLLPENIENLYAAMADAKAAQEPHGNEETSADEQAEATDRQDNAAEETQTTANQDSTDVDVLEQPNINDLSARQRHLAKQQRIKALHERIGSTPGGDDRTASQIEASLEQPVEPEVVVAKDEQGNTYTRKQIDWIGSLTRVQRAGAVLLGALSSVMSMHPDEAAAKRAHGSPAKLVIVQDIQTAYETLGLPPVPESVRRPEGPDGILPTIMKRHASDGHGEDLSNAEYADVSYSGHANLEAWTPYQSEAVNVGPIHPNHAEPTLCDVELVGQIWNGQDVVLNEYRSKRLFTTAQRKAIFARDKGCQAPGCMIQATYCQCHHSKEWSHGGQTNEDNAITLCAHHHADVHNGKWTIRKVDGVTYFQPAKWVDPYQPLLRNLYWNI